MLFDNPTPHQEDGLILCKAKIAVHESVHVIAVAGAGKTFFGVCLILEKVHSEPNARVLLVTSSEGLARFIIRWIGKRVRGSSKRRKVLERVHVLYPPMTEGPRYIDLEKLKGEDLIEALPIRTSPPVYDLIVVDEAHAVCTDPGLRESLKGWAGDDTGLLVLSGVSQARDDSKIYFPEDLKEITLTEVVRSSKRIIAGAMGFQLGGEKKLTRCYHDTVGPPLKPFVFPSVPDGNCGLYALHTVQALEYIRKEFLDLDIHDRVAILVPDSQFRETLLAQLPRVVDGMAIEFVSASDASAVAGFNGRRRSQSQWVVLEAIDQFDGMERLIIIAVGLDAVIDPSSDNASPPEVRSRLYRAITRANMMVIVVNEAIRGGWLEFLGHVEFTGDEATFSEEDSMKCCSDAAEQIMQETAAAKAAVVEPTNTTIENASKPEAPTALQPDLMQSPVILEPTLQNPEEIEPIEEHLVGIALVRESPEEMATSASVDEVQEVEAVRQTIWDVSDMDAMGYSLDSPFMPFSAHIPREGAADRMDEYLVWPPPIALPSH